jgi:hypothetical protein
MTKEQRDVRDLEERVSRICGDIRESDLHVVAVVSTGDPREDVFVLPARGGRYRVFSPRQRRQILEMMIEDGYEVDDDHWARTLTPAELAERDVDVPPLTPLEMVSDEDRPPVLDESIRLEGVTYDF